MDYILFLSLVSMACVMSRQARSEGKIIYLVFNSERGGICSAQVFSYKTSREKKPFN